MATKNFNSNSRFVDMWAVPGLHPSNMNLFQELKTADSRHYTHHMDSVGTVSERDESGGWQETHLIGIRNDIWKPDVKERSRILKSLQKKRKTSLRKEIKRSGRLSVTQTEKLEEKLEQDQLMQIQTGEIVTRRLVLKLFKTTTKRLQWCGTVEEVTSTEIHNSIATKKPLLTLAVMLPGTKLVTNIQQNHRTARIPSIFSFCYFHNDQPHQFVLKRRWLSFGADFDLICQNQSLGLIDGKLLSIGSNSYVNLKQHELAGNTQFQDLVTLFTASVCYHKAMWKGVKQRVRANLAGEESHCVTDDEEMRLHQNGRRSA